MTQFSAILCRDGVAAFSSTSCEKHPFVTAVSQRSDIFSEEGGKEGGICDQGWSYAAVLICTTTLQACERKLGPLLFKGKEFIFFISSFYLNFHSLITKHLNLTKPIQRKE